MLNVVFHEYAGLLGRKFWWSMEYLEQFHYGIYCSGVALCLMQVVKASWED